MSELSNRTKDWFSSQNKKFTNSFNKENLVGTTTTGLGILGNTISSASKLSQTADTSSLEAEIQDVKNFNPSAFNNNSLLNEWSNRNVLDRVSYDEIRSLQGSDIGSSIANNTLSGVTQGASAGGLWGGLIGGAISAIGSGIGALIGHNKALDEQRRLNKEIEQANKATTESFQHRASEIDTNQDYNLLANYSAYGGPIHIDKNKIGSFTREADKRGLRIQEFANKVLAHKNNYSTSMVKKANFAKNASTWKYAKGGSLNSIFTNGIIQINNGDTHEQNPYEGIQIGVDSQGIPNLVEEGEVIWNDYVFSNRIKVPKKLQDKYKVKNLTFAEAVKKLQKESEERPNDPISKNTLTSLLTPLQEEQEQIRMKKEINQLNKQYAHGGKLGNLFSGLGPQNNTLDKSDSVEPLDPIKKGASWLRYAPVVGSTIGLMESALSTPDYTHANAIERAARNASRYTPVGFTPIMNYMQYNPFDKNYYTNKLQSESGATRRAITNMGGPSRQAALLAADYNAQTKLGELFRQAEEYNLNQRQKVDEFNRATNMFNKEKGIQVALANQNQEAAGKQLGLQGIMASANMRENMDTARAQSIAQNTSNLFTNLGNIGQDEANRDMQKFYLRTTGTNLPLNEYASIFGIQDAKKEAAKRGYTPSQITTLFSKY